jgi:hypothetical protein
MYDREFVWVPRDISLNMKFKKFYPFSGVLCLLSSPVEQLVQAHGVF